MSPLARHAPAGRSKAAHVARVGVASRFLGGPAILIRVADLDAWLEQR